ncbi:MAG: ATP-grasp domain-containing protein [Chloroflexota bacterium]
MTKIGLLVGKENTFPDAFIDRVNSKRVEGVTAEFVRLHGGTRTDERIPYSVILDRISHEVCYYRAYCKKAVADGCTVINNPFWWSADDKFFECVLAQDLGVAIPRTIVLPSSEFPPDISREESLRNIVYPMPWEDMLDYTGSPAVLKPAIGGGNKNISIVHSVQELEEAYGRSNQLLMILQEKIEFENYVRCYCVGQNNVLISRYDHSLPHAERYVDGFEGIDEELRERIIRDVLTLNRALGYDMNTVEFAIRDRIPVAIDFLNPAPDSDRASIGPDRFEWVVEHLANFAIECALKRPESQSEFRWSSMINPVISAAVSG